DNENEFVGGDGSLGGGDGCLGGDFDFFNVFFNLGFIILRHRNTSFLSYPSLHFLLKRQVRGFKSCSLKQSIIL
ncbi:hypothetical protein 162275862, partial [Organic Lake phycodnavirus 2]